MRDVAREEIVNTVKVMEYSKGQVNELAQFDTYGVINQSKLRKRAKEMFPTQNVFLGDIETKKVRYSMSSDMFRKLAYKEDVE